MGKLFERSQRGYARSRKQAEKAWENKRTFRRPGRRWESKAQLDRMTYAEYLKSRYWQDTRRSFLKAASFRCQNCGASDAELNVHHISYEHRGCEWMYPHEVVVLCRDCHKKVHGIE